MNVGRDTHNGATISVRSSAIRRIAVDGNYSFLHRAISGAPGVFPTGTPTHKAVATATLLLPRGAAAILSAQHQDGIVAMSDNGLPLPTADFTIVDVSGQLPVRGRLRLQAGVKNLFDRDYFYWEGFPERGRNAYVTLRFAF